MKMGTPSSMRPHKGAKKKVIAAAAEHETTRMVARTSRFNRHTMIALGSSLFVWWWWLVVVWLGSRWVCWGLERGENEEEAKTRDLLADLGTPR
jgi:hypothetical protein